MDKVYIVTAGCYDDYRIEAVFSDKEKANEYKKIRDTQEGQDYREIDDWELDIPLDKYAITGSYSYRIGMITHKRVLPIDLFRFDTFNIRDRDLFIFAVKYDKKYDDDEVLLADVRKLAKEWE